MNDDAKRHKFDLILTKEISRFSRSTLDSIKYTQELLSNGVGVYFLNDNINTILPHSELRLTMMSSIAQDEVRRLSSRVKFGLERSVKDGKVLGGGNIIGYYKKNGELKIVKEKLKTKKLCTISGPSFAKDMAADSLVGLSLATTNKSTKNVVVNALSSDTLKIRSTNDFVGVELCGTMKNIIAIASGIFSEKEGIVAEEAALDVIAQKADGAMRDALSIPLIFRASVQIFLMSST